MKYHFKVNKEKNGYSAVCIELPGCITQANTLNRLEKNMSDALNLYLDEPNDSKVICQWPKKNLKGKNIYNVEVNPRVAFSFALRMARLSRKLTQRQAADLIGIVGSLNNYQRLENSDTANPVLETIVRIKRAFPDFPLDLIAA